MSEKTVKELGVFAYTPDNIEFSAGSGQCVRTITSFLLPDSYARIICCIVVANIYFNQSVLNLIAGSFPNEWGAVSLIPMVTRRLCGGILSDPPAIILNVSGLSCVKRRCFSAMIGMMLSPTATVLVFFSPFTGMAATVAQCR